MSAAGMHDNFTTQTVQELLYKSQSGGLHDVDDKQQACCSRGAGLTQQHIHQSMTYPYTVAVSLLRLSMC